MPNMTVPMQTPGAKSLPAELKVGGGNPWARMRAESPGFGRRTRTGWENGIAPGLRIGQQPPRLAGLGSRPTVWPVVSGNVVLNPVVASWGGLRGLGALRGLGQCDPTDPTCVEPPPPTDTFPTGNVCADGSVMDSSGICGGISTPYQVPGLPTGTIQAPAGYGGPVQIGAGVTPPTPPNGYAWAQVLNSSGQMIGQILAISQGGSVTTLPNGMKIVQGSTVGATTQATTGVAGAVASVFNSPQTMVMLMGGLLVVMLFAGGGRR